MAGKENYKSFCSEILDALDETKDKNDLDDATSIHDAFEYFAADLFGGKNNNVTGGSNDLGIDFYSLENKNLILGQCKCPDESHLLDPQQPNKYDRSVIHEIITGYTYLNDQKTALTPNSEILDLRAKTINDKNIGYELIVIVLGEFTDGARKYFDQEKNKLLKNNHVLRIIDWRELYAAYKQDILPPKSNIKIELELKRANTLISESDYCIAVVKVQSLIEAYEKNSMELFDLNVRMRLDKSKINREIQKTLIGTKRKNFHHLNNGILITCDSFNTKKPGFIKISNAQVVNGLQTITSSHAAYKLLVSDKSKIASFNNDTFVQAKIIQQPNPDHLNDIIVATNNQNPMNPRNLKSNYSEQKDINSAFLKMKPKWFYEKKDGEFATLTSKKTPKSIRRHQNIRKGDFDKRVMSNETLAKAWYAAIGCSDRTLMGGLNYFEDDYDKIFEMSPNSSYWNNFKSQNFQFKKNLLINNRPGNHQYLLIYLIYEYCRLRKQGFKLIRDNAINRLTSASPIQGQPAAQIDAALVNDHVYNVERITNNMLDINVELMVFVLANKYGDLNENLCRKIIKRTPENEFAEDLKPKEYNAHKKDALLFCCYEFIIYCFSSYYAQYQANILSQPRLKSFLSSRSFINALRMNLLDKDKNVMPLLTEIWKDPNKTFLDSLPARNNL